MRGPPVDHMPARSVYLESLNIDLVSLREENLAVLGEVDVQPSVRRYNLVLLATRVSKTPDSALVLHEGEREPLL